MPRPARLFLHIGLPKTGTTAWQAWADALRAALRAQGLDYPEAASITAAANHSAIQQSLMRQDMALPLRLLESGYPAMLLSAEGLSANLHDFPAGGLAAFRGVTAAIEVTCILVTRPAAAWVESMHRQAVLNNRNPRLGFGTGEPIENYAARPRVKAMLDHDRLAADAAAAFGAVRCEVIPYGPDAFARFCAVLGVDAAGLPMPERLNESVSAAAAALMRQVNALGPDEPLRSAMRWLLQAAEPTTHNLMRQAPPPDAAAAAALAVVMARLHPSGTAELELADRLRDILARQGVTNRRV